MKKWFLIFISVLLFLTRAGAQEIPSWQESTRKGNINLILILDVSTSMRSYFSEIQGYINHSILDQLLIDEDYLYFYTFGERITLRVNQTLDLPGNIQLLYSIINAIPPDEEATDIGLALDFLDKRLKETFPNPKSIIYFITDGKNDPPGNSPFYGKDIYAEGAFDAYEAVNEGAFKVFLLELGENTAADDLAEPLGGEVITVTSNITKEALADLIDDFDRSITMIFPESLGSIKSREIELPISFESTYSTKKVITVKSLYYYLDRGPRMELDFPVPSFSLSPAVPQSFSVPLTLPATVSSGDHRLKVEFRAENQSISRSIARSGFTYSPLPWWGVIAFILFWLLVVVIVYVFIKSRS